MSQQINQWDTQIKKAKNLESKLEAKVQKYSYIAQRINADFLCDEENPLMESKEENELATDIERDLCELSECINSMRDCPHNNLHSAGLPSHQQEALIKRYHEIHFDYTTEFKNTLATIQRKRESMELFKPSKNGSNGDEDSSVAKLLRERSSIAASMKSINDVISQAFETKAALTNQRNTLSGAAGGLSGLTANIPTFNRLIEGINKKKSRDQMIIALVIAIILCFSIWWFFLR